MKKMLFLGIGALLVTGMLLSSCSMNKDLPPEPLEPYKVYDQKVESLREAVKNETMTVAKAEREREKAFREYLEALGGERVANEYRNY